MQPSRREPSVHHPTRRRVLRWGAYAGAGLLAARPARATACRALSLYAVNTGERLRVDYCIDGRYDPHALGAIAHLLRDVRAGAVHAIDPRLLDSLSRMQRLLGATTPLHVVSGYRTRETNEQKRRRDRHVAANSYHVRGQAADVFVPGRPLASVRRVATALRAGGVGYYPDSGFVHVDTGPIRTW
jgi:uncharacterized protein YcbK (DUF882 family)